MQRPSTPFLVLGGIMILLFVVGLILIAVLISRNSSPSDIELTATAIIGSNQSLEAELRPTQTQAALEAQTLAAATPTAASP
jgi:hypothetical protein